MYDNFFDTPCTRFYYKFLFKVIAFCLIAVDFSICITEKKKKEEEKDSELDVLAIVLFPGILKY